mmetsp:Transcript_35401/g.75631  ORF Transcript_35401/g.75631 Transcript_35401/m.75631 type:complete len:113 (-) Transcript_35401:374-712(-)
MGSRRDAGWGKRKTGSIGRHGHGNSKKQQPAKKAWMIGEEAKAALRAAAKQRTTRAASDEATAQREEPPAPPPEKHLVSQAGREEEHRCEGRRPQACGPVAGQDRRRDQSST